MSKILAISFSVIPTIISLNPSELFIPHVPNY